MIHPCIDLMGGKVVQLVQGHTVALELESAEEALTLFGAFPVIHVIDLDAAMDQGDNSTLVGQILTQKRARVGGGVRTIKRAEELIRLGAEQVIIGTRAFSDTGIDAEFLSRLVAAVGRDKVVCAIDSRNGRVTVKGWREGLALTPVQAAQELEPFCAGFLCTCVDREGLMQGTDMNLFLSLRQTVGGSVTAAGGVTTLDEVRTLVDAGIGVALGMSVYTGRLDLNDLASLVTL